MKKNNLVEVRIPLHLNALLDKSLAFNSWHESVVFGLASHARLRHKTLLLVKKIFPLPAEAYIRGAAHGARWHGRAMIPILNEAISEKLGIIIFHAHLHRGAVSLSGDDRRSAMTLLPMFQNSVGSRPHASFVLGEDHAAGMVLMPEQSGFQELIRVRCLGNAIRDLECNEQSISRGLPDEIHHRQALLTGTVGEQSIKRAKISVVGLSGGGSHVVQQLAHMGVGEIIGIDGEKVETSNRGRLIGMTGLDVLLLRRKTSVMARMVRRINRRVKFTGVPHHLPRQPAIDALKESDIVIGCLDNYHAKADLQELAWRYMIPYIDIGMLIRPDKQSRQITIGGNVLTLIPGGFCQWCNDFLSEEKLKEETGGRPRSYFEGSKKQAQVVSFNGTLASQAVTEVLKLLTGFAPPTGEFTFKKFDGLEGTLQNWIVKKKNDCSCCLNLLGGGDPVWEQV